MHAAAVSKATCEACLGLTGSDPPVADKIVLDGNELEVVNKFCYLGDMLDAKGGAESSSIARVQCGWKKFNDLLPFLGSRAVSLPMKGEIYSTCVFSEFFVLIIRMITIIYFYSRRILFTSSYTRSWLLF